MYVGIMGNIPPFKEMVTEIYYVCWMPVSCAFCWANHKINYTTDDNFVTESKRKKNMNQNKDFICI